MVLSSQAFAFHRVRGLVFENPQPQPQAESYVKLFIEADGMQGVGGNPAGAPNAGVFAHELLGYRTGPLDEIECASGTTRSSQSGITRDQRSIKAFGQGDVRGVVGGDGLAQLPHPSQRGRAAFAAEEIRPDAPARAARRCPRPGYACDSSQVDNRGGALLPRLLSTNPCQLMVGRSGLDTS